MSKQRGHHLRRRGQRRDHHDQPPEGHNASARRPSTSLSRRSAPARADREARSIILTGAGEKALAPALTPSSAPRRDYGPSESGMFEIGYLHKLSPRRAQARHRSGSTASWSGAATSASPCDVSTAADTARFGQAGPSSAPSTPASAYLARVVGEKKAREIWVRCRQLLADEAFAMGLVNKAVPWAPTTERQGVGVRDQREEPDRDQVPQVVVQRRHGPPGRLLQHGDDGARPSRYLDEGMRRAPRPSAEKRQPDFNSKAHLH